MSSRSIKLCVSALFVALLTVGSWTTIPAAVPFTLQSFVMYWMLLLLPPSYAFSATSGYLLLGACGLPVFAGFQGGLSVLFGPLGGFLWGFLAMALVHGVWRPHASLPTLLCLLTETLLCYTVGTVWYALYLPLSFQSVLVALSVTVAPFVIPDALKFVLAWYTAKRLRSHLPF